MSKFKLGAIALALTLTTALPINVPYTAGLIGAPAAQAGILGKIKGAVKAVGSEAKNAVGLYAKSAKNAAVIAGGKAKAVGGVYKDFAKDTVKAAKNAGKIIGVDKAAKKIGGGIKNAAQVAKQTVAHDAPNVGRALKGAGRKIGAVAKDVGGNIGDELKKDGKAIGRGTKAVGSAIKDGAKAGVMGYVNGFWAVANKFGLETPRFEPPSVPSKGNKALPRSRVNKTTFKGSASKQLTKLNILGSPKPIPVKAPNQGISKDDLGVRQPGKGIRKHHGSIGRDKSVWGRPVGVKRKHIGRDKSVWGRPLGMQRNHIGRDKSVWGRAVGVKRNHFGRNESMRRHDKGRM
jgi:hypothetical protein